MSIFVKVAEQADINEGSSKIIEINNRQIALFKVDGKICAIDNICLHQGGPLGEGMLNGRVVTCPWHSWQFDITTGRNIQDQAICVDTFDVRLENNDVFLNI